MPKVEVEINSEVLNWVMGQINMEHLDEKTQINLYKWRNGEKQPTVSQIEELSKKTNIPFGYFFLKTPPIEKLPILECRTVNSNQLNNPSRNLVDTIYNMENIQDWMHDYMLSIGADSLKFVGSQKDNEDSISFADIMRNELDLKINWFEDTKDSKESFKLIRKNAERLGIVIMINGIVGNNTRRKLDLAEFRAFTLIDEYAPLIFINSNDSDNGKLFSLIHEMAHIWLGENSLFNEGHITNSSISRLETLCNAITGEFLVPGNFFLDYWKKYLKIDQEKRITSLARDFRCSVAVVARKALSFKLISDNAYNDIVKKAVEKFNNLQNEKTSGGDFYANQLTRYDHRFLSAIANDVAEGKTLYSDAFRLTNTNRCTFTKLIEKLEGNNGR